MADEGEWEWVSLECGFRNSTVYVFCAHHADTLASSSQPSHMHTLAVHDTHTLCTGHAQATH
eukprot:1698271-Rhodomonas_salina.1